MEALLLRCTPESIDVAWGARRTLAVFSGSNERLFICG